MKITSMNKNVYSEVWMWIIFAESCPTHNAAGAQDTYNFWKFRVLTANIGCV